MKSILVIDDDADQRYVLKTMLTEAGYQVSEASNGKAGCQLFLKTPFDLVITDIYMPEQEGIETIMKLKKIHPNVKIIAISGGSQVDGLDLGNVLDFALSLGANHTVNKPIETKKFLNLVKEIFNPV